MVGVIILLIFLIAFVFIGVFIYVHAPAKNYIITLLGGTATHPAITEFNKKYNVKGYYRNMLINECHGQLDYLAKIENDMLYIGLISKHHEDIPPMKIEIINDVIHIINGDEKHSIMNPLLRKSLLGELPGDEEFIKYMGVEKC